MLPIHTHSELQEAVRSDYPNYDDPELADISLFAPTDYYDGDTFAYDNSLSEPMLISPELGLAIQLGYKSAFQHGGDPRFRLYPYSKTDGLDTEQVLFVSDAWKDIQREVQKRGILCHLDRTHLDNRTLESFRQAPKSFEDDKMIGFTTIGNLACVVRKMYNQDREPGLSFSFVIPAEDSEKQDAIYARGDILKTCPALPLPPSLFVTHKELLSVKSDTLFLFIGEKIADIILKTPRNMDLAVYEPLQFMTNEVPMDPSFFALYEALETPCDFEMGDIDKSLAHTLTTTNEQYVTRYAHLNRLRFELCFTIPFDRPPVEGYRYLLRLFIKGEDGSLHLVLVDATGTLQDYEVGESIVEWAKLTMLRATISAVQKQYLPLCALDRDSTETLSFDWHQLTRRDFVHFVEAFKDANAIPESEANHWIVSYDGYPFLPYRTDDMESFYLADAMQAKKSKEYPLQTVLAMTYEAFQSFVETTLRELAGVEDPMEEEPEEDDEDFQDDEAGKPSDGLLPGLSFKLGDEDALPYICLGTADDGTVTLYQPVQQKYETADAKDLVGKDVPNAYPMLKDEIFAFVQTHLKKRALEQEQEKLKMRLEAIELELDALSLKEADQAKTLHQKASFQLSEEDVVEAFQQSRLALPFHAMGKVKTTFLADKLPFRLMLETKTVLSTHPERSVFALLLNDTDQGEMLDTDNDMYQETLESLVQSSWMRPGSAELALENGTLYFVRLYPIVLPQYVLDRKALIEHFNRLADAQN